jgi:hypothetical protein
MEYQEGRHYMADLDTNKQAETDRRLQATTKYMHKRGGRQPPVCTHGGR